MMRDDSNSSLNSMLDEGGWERATTTTTNVLKKGPWSAVEDAILIEYVQKHGEGSWNSVQKNCGLARCGKSCRLRWANHLRPNLKKGCFTPEEEMLILQLHAQFGNKWARMAGQMPGRTDNEIKNYWNTRIKRRQRAGLPLYMASSRPPPSMSPSPIPHSPLQLFRQPALSNPLVPESPRVKRLRDDGPTFRFSLGSPYLHHPHPQQTIQYNNRSAYGNHGNLDDMNMNILLWTTGLPSTQLYNGGDGGCRLMDALLQEQGAKLVFSDQQLPIIYNDNGSNGADKDLRVDSYGISMKREQSGVEEANPDSTHDDVFSTPMMPPALEWQNANTADDISNGGQSSVVTDDELGLELQHLASSVFPAGQEWNIRSCPWSNMPGIG